MFTHFINQLNETTTLCKEDPAMVTVVGNTQLASCQVCQDAEYILCGVNGCRATFDHFSQWESHYRDNHPDEYLADIRS